jgi:hypothetical protein
VRVIRSCCLTEEPNGLLVGAVVADVVTRRIRAVVVEEETEGGEGYLSGDTSSTKLLAMKCETWAGR